MFKPIMCSECHEELKSIRHNGRWNYKSENPVIDIALRQWDGFNIHHECLKKLLKVLDEEGEVIVDSKSKQLQLFRSEQI